MRNVLPTIVRGSAVAGLMFACAVGLNAQAEKKVVQASPPTVMTLLQRIVALEEKLGASDEAQKKLAGEVAALKGQLAASDARANGLAAKVVLMQTDIASLQKLAGGNPTGYCGSQMVGAKDYPGRYLRLYMACQ